MPSHFFQIIRWYSTQDSEVSLDISSRRVFGEDRRVEVDWEGKNCLSLHLEDVDDFCQALKDAKTVFQDGYDPRFPPSDWKYITSACANGDHIHGIKRVRETLGIRYSLKESKEYYDQHIKPCYSS